MTFADAVVHAAQQQHLSAVASEDASALLGACVHQLLAHATSDGSEVALLQRVSDLWAIGSDLCDELGTIRADLEQALEHPADPSSARRFNDATVKLQELANRAIALSSDIDQVRSAVLTWRHLPPHPRQHDLPVEQWDWASLTLARRTDALVRSLFRLARGPAGIAFAIGAAASYGANAVGSAYLGQGVGGPRRTQRYRDRVARNAVGGWLAEHHPAAQSPGAMAQRMTFGTPTAPVLPHELVDLLTRALNETFNITGMPPLPDLQVGYVRLVKHLTLLDGFRRPPPPEPPTQLWAAKLADPNHPSPTLYPQDIDVSGQDGGGVGVQIGGNQPGSSSPDGSDNSSTQKGCGIAIALIILIDLAQAFGQCVVQWAKKETCTFWDNMLLKKLWEQDPPDPRDPSNPNASTAQLTAVVDDPRVAHLIGALSDVHNQAWEAVDRAYAFLAGAGLIYPGDLIGQPMYAQFTSVPTADWPAREEADPARSYHRFPPPPLEEPSTVANWFPAGSSPSAIVDPNGPVHAAGVAVSVWQQIAAGQHDSPNRDLDADRGLGHECWVAGNSVHANPVDVVVLAYDQQ